MEAQDPKSNTPERGNKRETGTHKQSAVDTASQLDVGNNLRGTSPHNTDDGSVHHPTPSSLTVNPIHLESSEDTSPSNRAHTTQDLRTVDWQQSPGVDDISIPDVVPNTPFDNNSRVTSKSTLASSTFESVDNHCSTTSAPHSPESQQLAIRETSNQAFSTTPFDTKPQRPTSVPIVTSNSAAGRTDRDDIKYPKYPDRSFNDLPSLQSQHHSPLHPQPLRTRSSHTSQDSSFPSISSRNSQDQISLVTGARTVGNTPAQSPGLFDFIYPTSRNQVEGSEDSQTNTPLMHPAHKQTPKE